MSTQASWEQLRLRKSTLLDKTEHNANHIIPSSSQLQKSSWPVWLNWELYATDLILFEYKSYNKEKMKDVAEVWLDSRPTNSRFSLLFLSYLIIQYECLEKFCICIHMFRVRLVSTIIEGHIIWPKMHDDVAAAPDLIQNLSQILYAPCDMSVAFVWFGDYLTSLKLSDSGLAA